MAGLAPEAGSREPNGVAAFLRTYGEWAGLLLILLAVAIIRYRLLGVPFDRDEGGYAYGGRLLLEGKRTYTDFYTMRYPAVFAAYALIMAVLGQTHVAVHGALLVMNAANIVLVFLLARRLFDPLVGVLAATFFALLSLGSYPEAFSANSEQFASLFATAGILHLVRTLDRERDGPVLLSGCLLGLAYLMKQQAVLFVAFGGLYLLAEGFWARAGKGRVASRVGLYVWGAALPFLLTAAFMAVTGRFDAFLFWTFTYASTYAASMPLALGWEIFQHRFPLVVMPALETWLLAALGLAAVWRPDTRNRAFFLMAFFLCAAVATSIGLYFRSHYFRFMFPPLALSAALGTVVLGDFVTRKRFRNLAALAIGVAVAILVCLEESAVFFRLSPDEVSRKTNGLNPFPESLEIARYLKGVTGPEDDIAVIGSEPQIYFYSERHAVTGHIYTYQLMEPHPYARAMQEEMIQDIESAKPKYVVVAFMPTSWLVHEDAEMYIFDWLETFLGRHYERVGLIDILSEVETNFYWDEAARGREPESRLHLGVYRRRSAPPPEEESPAEEGTEPSGAGDAGL